MTAPGEQSGLSASGQGRGQSAEALLVVGVVAVLAGLLVGPFLRAWVDLPDGLLAQVGRLLAGHQSPEDRQATIETISQAAGQLLKHMLSPFLLPAMGFLWVLQRRKVDLSVWMGFYLGAGAGAALVCRGAHPLVVLAGAAGAGAALGVVNAAGAARLRLPVWLVTLATAILATSAVLALVGGAPLRLHSQNLAGWSGGNRPALLVFIFFAAGMAVWWLLVPRRGGPALAAVLVGASILSALGGLCWLVKSGEAPAPSWIIGDLRVAAAAVLAGGLILRGTEPAMLAGLLLPPAMLVATIWPHRVLDYPQFPFALNLLLLALLALAGQWAFVAPAGRKGWPWSVLAVAGLIVLAVSGRTWPEPAERALQVAGLALGLLGLSGTVWLAIPRRRPSLPQDRS